jgi:hypothetical protein
VTASYTDAFGQAESVTSTATAAVANVNDSPTGTVSISGAPTPGQTLTATNTLADIDGLGTVSYQWLANESAITDATSSTFLITPYLAGQQISVRASYTDLQGTAESVTSASRKINTPPVARDNSYSIPEDESLVLGNLISDGWEPGTAGETLFRDTDADGDALSISAVTVGGVLTAWADLPNSSELADLAAAQAGQTWKTLTLPNGTAWLKANGELRYAGNAHETLGDTLGYTITDGQGGSASAQVQIKVLPVNDPPTGKVTISGTATQGQVLTAANTLADIDGLGTISYQWKSDGVNISDATANTLTLTQEQVGKSITAVASYTDSFGKVESVSSSATELVANVNDAPFATAASVTTDEDTAKSGTLAGTDVEGSSLTFAKVSDPANGAVTINASTGAYTYTPKANHNGSDSFTFKVNDGTVDSETASVSITVQAVNDTPTGSVTISGGGTQGQVLTAANTLADVDGIPSSGAGAIAYHWLADGDNISGAKASTFTLTQAQVGKFISVRASYTDLLGTAESVTSASLKINTPPVARDNSYTIAEDDTQVLGNLITDGWAPGTAGQTLFRDTDADGDALSISAITVGGMLTALANLPNSNDPTDLADAQAGQPWKAIPLPNGTAWLKANGELRYAGNANETLGDTLSYTITDGQGGTASAQVQIKVLSVDDPTTASLNISGSAKTGGSLSLGVSNIADPDGTPSLAYQWQWLNDQTWQNIDGATSNTWAIPTGSLWAERAVRAQLSTTDPMGGKSVFQSDAQTIEASSQLVLSAAHWKTGKVLPGVGVGLYDGATELKTGSDGKLSAQGFQDPDGVDDGQTVLNPSLVINPKQASITLTDVLGALKVYLGKPLPEAYNNDLKFIAADFDGNGTVNLTDVLGLLKFYLNKPVNAAPAWVFVDSAQTTTANGQTLHLSSKSGQTLSTTAAAPSPILADLNSDESVQLLGVLRGDVDGSWVG